MSGSPESLVFLRDSVAFSAITGGALWSRRTRDSSCRACVKACLSSLSCVECVRHTHDTHTAVTAAREAQRVKNVHGKAPPRLGRTRSRRVSAGLSRDGCSIVLHTARWEMFLPPPTLARLHTDSLVFRCLPTLLTCAPSRPGFRAPLTPHAPAAALPAFFAAASSARCSLSILSRASRGSSTCRRAHSVMRTTLCAWRAYS